MITKEVMELARQVCDYLMMHHKLEKSDCILVLGTYDERLAIRGADLFLQGYAPLLIISGGLGEFAKKYWHEAEAERFARIAMKMGVPKDKILIENKSTNTGENIIFTKKLLKENGLNPQRFIIVQKPHMERRSYATFKKHWPEKDILLTSPQIPLEQYPTKGISMERVINTAVGDLQRVKIYPEKGFQIYQEIPDDVWKAFKKLVAMGYNKRLITD